MDLRRSRSKNRSRIGRTPMVYELRVRPPARAIRPGRSGEGAGWLGRADSWSTRVSPDAFWPGWWGWANSPSARSHDRGEGGKVKGPRIWKGTYVDPLDVSRVA